MVSGHGYCKQSWKAANSTTGIVRNEVNTQAPVVQGAGGRWAQYLSTPHQGASPQPCLAGWSRAAPQWGTQVSQGGRHGHLKAGDIGVLGRGTPASWGSWNNCAKVPA